MRAGTRALVKREFSLAAAIMTELIAYAHPQLSERMKMHGGRRGTSASPETVAEEARGEWQGRISRSASNRTGESHGILQSLT